MHFTISESRLSLQFLLLLMLFKSDSSVSWKNPTFQYNDMYGRGVLSFYFY